MSESLFSKLTFKMYLDDHVYCSFQNGHSLMKKRSPSSWFTGICYYIIYLHMYLTLTTCTSSLPCKCPLVMYKKLLTFVISFMINLY